MFAIVDIETCGSKFRHPQGRIIDIAILIHDGLQVVDRFSTLINPGCYISGFYSNLSGITNDMVADAPHFHQVAKQIVELTEGKIFVAHNVGFDYSFIKEEFAFLGYNFRREKLCTVRLSRKLLPKRISYSLGHLCASLNIPIENRHRALGDAEATAKLFDLLLQVKSQNPQYRKMGVDELMARRIDKIKDYVLKKLPEECGVYYFLDKEGKIIYIGKSTNIYNRAMSHFNNHERKGKKMLNELYNVEFELTGSEIIALLLETEEIKKHKPYFNRAQKADIFTHSINWYEDKQGIINFKIAPYDEAGNSLQAFTTHIAALKRLESWMDEYSLCLKYCGLSEDEVCFNHQIKKCHGICAGLETVELYNQRANTLVEEYSFGKKNFMVIDKGRRPDEQSLILIEDGHYAGYGYFDTSTQMENPAELKELIKHTTYYADQDNLVRGYLKSKTLRKILL
ncbi:MAG: exonuclease domain-containing protein [Bacteroidia bacterium]